MKRLGNAEYVLGDVQVQSHCMCFNGPQFPPAEVPHAWSHRLPVIARTVSFIDPFHKWLPIISSLVDIKTSLTNLVLELIIQKNFYSQTSLVRLI